MQNKLTILACLFISIIAYSQDKEPNPMNYIWDIDNMSKPFEPDSFSQNSMMLGFQWGGSRVFSNYLTPLQDFRPVEK
jgi:hypothetical protein